MQQAEVEAQETELEPQSSDEEITGEDNLLRLVFSPPETALKPLAFNHSVFQLSYLDPKDEAGNSLFPSEVVARRVFQLLVNGGTYTRLTNGPSTKTGYEIKKILTGKAEPTSKEVNVFTAKQVDPWKRDNAVQYAELLLNQTSKAIETLFKGDIADVGVRAGDEHEREVLIALDADCMVECRDKNVEFPRNAKDEVIINGKPWNRQAIRDVVREKHESNGKSYDKIADAVIAARRGTAPSAATKSAFD